MSLQFWSMIVEPVTPFFMLLFYSSHTSLCLRLLPLACRVVYVLLMIRWIECDWNSRNYQAAKTKQTERQCYFRVYNILSVYQREHQHSAAIQSKFWTCDTCILFYCTPTKYRYGMKVHSVTCNKSQHRRSF